MAEDIREHGLIDESSGACFRRQKQPGQSWPTLAHPFLVWSHESELVAASPDCLGDHSAHRFAEDVLAVTAPDLQVRRQGRDQLRETMVEKWNACLNRECHRVPILVAEQCWQIERRCIPDQSCP